MPADNREAIIDKLRQKKIDQYTKLYEVSKETEQISQEQYAVKEIMAYHGDLTEDMAKSIKKLPVGLRDSRRTGGKSSYISKWLFGDYKSFMTFDVKGESFNVTESYGETQYQTNVHSRQVELLLNEIVLAKTIKELQENVSQMDKRCDRGTTYLGDHFVERTMEGENIVYQIMPVGGTASSCFGYIIVKGIPGKRGYIVVTIIDTEMCKKAHINANNLGKAAGMEVEFMLTMLNSGYAIKTKSIV